MTTFYTDADLSGSGEFVESEVWLASEFTVPDGSAVPRWRWPTIAPSVTPVIRIYNASGTLVAGPISFDTSTVDAWNTAGASSPVSLSAGTYRVTVNTTRYVARSGYFSGGSITRGSITGVQSRFGSPGSAPASTSTATYFIDIDFTASGGSTVNGTATLASTSSLTAAATVVRQGQASLASASVLIAAGTARVSGSAVLSSASSLTASTTSTVPGAAAFASVSALAGSAAVVRVGTATLASTSSLAGAGTRIVPASAALASTSALTASASLIARGSAALNSASALTAVVGNVNQPGALTVVEVAAGLSSAAAAARPFPSQWP